jgi:hypothetical protein
MTTFTLHTPTSPDLLRLLVAGQARVTEGRTLRGEPDCFAGWFERADSPDCLPNNLVEGEDREAIHMLASALVAEGHQVIVTAPDVDGNDEVVLDMPSNYVMAHGH